MKTQKYEIDMCTGPVFSKLIRFVIPMMIANFGQILFTAVDMIVVGRFAGSDALAAVGATTSLINVLITVFTGISMGSNVLAARAFAQRSERKMSVIVHTSMAFAFLIGFGIIGVGLLLSKPALLLMGTPKEILPMSCLYMRIYFLGMPFFMTFTYGAAILRAVGDTKRPLFYLTCAGIINAVLNVVLVTLFHRSVDGVAIATVISQLVSGLLVLRCLIRSTSSYRFEWKKLGIDRGSLIKILQIGLPAGIQSGIVNLSNAMLQSSVNSFGAMAMAGYTAVNNILSFLWVIVDTVSQACMSFVSQNYGVNKPDRMDKVLKDAMLFECTAQLLISNTIFVFGEYILRIYTDSDAAISAGKEIMLSTIPLYFICGAMNIIPGAIRGMGVSTMPMLLSLIGTVGTRVVWIYGVFPFHRSLSFLFISYPLSWFLTMILQIVCFVRVRKSVFAQLKEKR